MREQYDDSAIDLSQVFGVAFLRWRIIATGMLASLAIWFLVTNISGGDDSLTAAELNIEPITYSATSVYELEADSSGAFAADEIVRLTHAMTETYRVVMASQTTFASLASVVGLSQTPEELSSGIKFTTTQNTPFISITSTYTSPAVALTMANGFVAALDSVLEADAFGLSGISLKLVEYEPATDAIRNETVGPVEVSSPINPLVLFLLAGVVVTSFAVLIVEWIDQRANWTRQVVANTGFSAIGRLRNRKKQVDPEFMVRREDTTGVESFRMAKTRLAAVMGASELGHSLLVASPRAGEGKTFVLANLADALSEDGGSVVVVSSDLRSASSIDDIWHAPENTPGLPDFLIDGSIDPQDVTIDTERIRVHLIPRGTASDDARPLIDSTRMSQLIDQLKERYDWVLLDSPGTLDTADAVRLSSLVDGTLVVVDGTRTRLTSVNDAFSVLEGAGARIVGFFHNRYRADPVASMLGRSLG